eukprot:tig00021123_g18508.t1
MPAAAEASGPFPDVDKSILGIQLGPRHTSTVIGLDPKHWGEAAPKARSPPLVPGLDSLVDEFSSTCHRTHTGFPEIAQFKQPGAFRRPPTNPKIEYLWPCASSSTGPGEWLNSIPADADLLTFGARATASQEFFRRPRRMVSPQVGAAGLELNQLLALDQSLLKQKTVLPLGVHPSPANVPPFTYETTHRAFHTRPPREAKHQHLLRKYCTSDLATSGEIFHPKAASQTHGHIYVRAPSGSRKVITVNNVVPGSSAPAAHLPEAVRLPQTFPAVHNQGLATVYRDEFYAKQEPQLQVLPRGNWPPPEEGVSQSTIRPVERVPGMYSTTNETYGIYYKDA